MVSVSVSFLYVASIALWNPYSFSAAAWSLSTWAGSVTPLGSPFASQPAKDSGSKGCGTDRVTAFEGDGGGGDGACEGALRAEPASATVPIETAIQRINVFLPVACFHSDYRLRRSGAF